MDWFLYDNRLRHERVKDDYCLLLCKSVDWFLYKKYLRYDAVLLLLVLYFSLTNSRSSAKV